MRIVACGICHTDLAVRDAQLPVPLPVGARPRGRRDRRGGRQRGDRAPKPGDRVVMSFKAAAHARAARSTRRPIATISSRQLVRHAAPTARPSMTLGGAADGGQFLRPVGLRHARHRAPAQRRCACPTAPRPSRSTRSRPIGCGADDRRGRGARRDEGARRAADRGVRHRHGRHRRDHGGARSRGADPIIAVDVNDERLALAPRARARPMPSTRATTRRRRSASCARGLGYAFDTTGINTVIEQAWGLLAPKGIAASSAHPTRPTS